jgi:hypothetical protein
MFLAKKLNNGAGPPPATLDPQFNYVTMLLHGDGTNGAQNNTFLDSSSSARTVNRVGTPTQGSFSPYGDNWSNFFPNASPATSYLVSGSYTLSGDFTVEGYVNWNGEGPNPAMFTFGDSSLATGFEVYKSGANWILYASNGVRATGSAAVAGQWTYLSVTRSGTTVTLYINGVSQGTWTSSQTFSGTIKVGAEFYGGVYYSSMSGYISNFRVNNTTAINAVPTTPLTSVSGTIFLTCQSNRFIETSNNSAITVNGTPSVQRFNPFGTATAYSTSVIGGSGYFNTGNYLSVTGLGTISSGDNYCYEMWVYPTEFRSGEMRLMGSSVNDPLLQFTSNTDLQFFVNNTFICGYSTTFKPNQWYHIAITKNAGTSYLFVNGIQRASGGNGFGINNKTFLIGAQETSPTIGLIGYMTDFRPWIGTAAYGSNFTPPTSPMTATSFNPLLLNFTNGAIFDNAMMNDLETVGNAQISTSVVKYGTGSISNVASASLFLTQEQSFGTGDFTWETWIYPTAYGSGTGSNYSCIFADVVGVGSSNVQFTLSSIGRFSYYNGVSTIITTTATPTLNTWSHVALVRSNGTSTIYLDGTSIGSAADSANIYLNSIGGFYPYSSGNSFRGYFDEVRITKGYARYTANFTPPTAAFFNTGPY